MMRWMKLREEVECENLGGSSDDGQENVVLNRK